MRGIGTLVLYVDVRNAHTCSGHGITHGHALRVSRITDLYVLKPRNLSFKVLESEESQNLCHYFKVHPTCSTLLLVRRGSGFGL